MDEIRWTKKLLLISRYFIKLWTKNDRRWTKKKPISVARYSLLAISLNDGRKTIDDGRWTKKKPISVARYLLFHKRWTKNDRRRTKNGKRKTTLHLHLLKRIRMLHKPIVSQLDS